MADIFGVQRAKTDAGQSARDEGGDFGVIGDDENARGHDEYESKGGAMGSG